MPHQCVNCGRAFGDGSKEMLSGCPNCDGKKFQFTPAEPDDGADATGAATTANEGGDEFGVTMETADSSTLAGTTDGASAASDPADVDGTTTDADAGETAADAAPEDSGTRRPDGRAAEDAMTFGVDDADVDPEAEDDAQTTARSSMVDTDELSAARQARAEAERERLAEVERDDPDAESHSDSASGIHPDSEEATADPGRSADADPSDAAVDGETSASTAESPDLAALREELNSQFESIKIVAPGQYELNLMELYDREEYIVSLQEDGRYVIEVPESWHDEPE